MQSIPDDYHDLFERETIAHFATLMADGTPQVTPVWIDLDEDGNLLVNTARGRQKERNVRENTRVGLSITDPSDDYRYLSIRGAVAEITTDGADAHIDSLARRYMGVEEYPHHGEEIGERVIIRIEPEAVAAG